MFKCLSCMLFIFSFDIYCATFSGPFLEDVVERSDFIGLIEVVDIYEKDDLSCGLLVKAIDVSTGSDFFIYVSKKLDVPHVGKHLAFIREFRDDRDTSLGKCFGEVKSKRKYVSFSAFQTIFPFGNDVSISKKNIYFSRESILSGNVRVMPKKDFIKRFEVFPDRIVAEVEFSSVLEHLCESINKHSKNNAIIEFCSNFHLAP